MPPNNLTDQLDELLAQYVSKEGPGVQVVVVSSSQILYQGARGLANPIKDGNETVTPYHQANLYSLSKFFTACSLRKLVQQGKLGPSDPVVKYLPTELKPFVDKNCTVEQLVAHAGGAPNPLPLGWVHSPEESVDSTLRLQEVLKNNPFKTNSQKQMYYYSNVGYWILEHVVTSVCQVPRSKFADCCHELLFSDLISKDEAESFITDKFTPNVPLHYGHIPKWSLLSLVARLCCPPYLRGPSSSRYIRMEPHYIDGVGYGGLIGSSQSVGRFLQSILRDTSQMSSDPLFCPLLNKEMTWGLHVRPHAGVRVFHKEGGGAGCHSSLQFRPGLAACMIAGDAAFDVNRILDQVLDCVQDYQRLQCQPAQQVKCVSVKDGLNLYTVRHSGKNKSNENSSPILGNESILCLSGGPGVPDYLQDFASLVVNSNVCNSVITFDPRGVGQSSSFSTNTTISMEHLLSDIDDIRKAYGLEKIHLVGHSWGGVLARLYAQHYPNHVASLVLLSPTTVQQGSDWSAMEGNVMLFNRRQGGLWNFLKMGLWSLLMHVPGVSDYATRQIMRRVMKNYYFDAASAPEPSANFLRGVSSRTMMQCKNAFIKKVKEPIEWNTATIPSCCVFGDGDIYGENSIREFCQNFSGQATVLSQCSHLSWVDQPLELGKHLAFFYRSNFK